MRLLGWRYERCFVSKDSDGHQHGSTAVLVGLKNMCPLLYYCHKLKEAILLEGVLPLPSLLKYRQLVGS